MKRTKGANPVFTGDKLVTTCSAGGGADAALFARLMRGEVPMRVTTP